MDKTNLTKEVAELFRLSGHTVETSVRLNHREIDVVAKELQGLIQKTLLIECADYSSPVGVQKIQEDIDKLSAAREHLKETAVLVHVSRLGYTPEAAGYASDKGVSHFSIENLRANLINFDPYISAIENDKLYPVIISEYQTTTVSDEGGLKKDGQPAGLYLDHWLSSPGNYLIVLGDYGVGKSWMLRRYLYTLLERYKSDRDKNPLPLFIPLQRFTKAFDFQNLILRCVENYGLSGIHYDALLHLIREGRVVLLLDSFDEMAQHLGKSAIRENLGTIFEAISPRSKVIMTSRPNYFENKAERFVLVERFDTDNAHPLDVIETNRQIDLSESIQRKLESTSFARLNDLTDEQRERLFDIVLSDKPIALRKIKALLSRFHSLKALSQRAVIARLLTTVAETLATEKDIETVDGQQLLPDNISTINQWKIFEIIIYNLLQRDQGIGLLPAADRLRFLKSFALYLQRRGSDSFASPDELKSVVRDVFSSQLSRTDSPEQDFENYYRTCRRHSGLTTEGQFFDTSGVIDLPVSETDFESRIGFSHNSLREFLVAAAILDVIAQRGPSTWNDILPAMRNDLIQDFIYESLEYQPDVANSVREEYLKFDSSRKTELLFDIIYHLFGKNTSMGLDKLGKPPQIRNVDLSFKHFPNADLSGGVVSGCILLETDFTGCNLKEATVEECIIDRLKLDRAQIQGADFSRSTVDSLLVHDAFDRRTFGILEGKAARQWIFSRGGKVESPNELNPLMGKPWYEAAREVTRTIERKYTGTHQERSLAKGTDLKYRAMAGEFVSFLVDAGILERVHKSQQGGGWVVKLNGRYLSAITAFSRDGKIEPILMPFFDKHRELT